MPTSSSRAGSLTTLSADTLPRSVRDAIQSRRLRFDANNEVQVYILLSAVDDNTIQQLTDLGVTIEIRDAARRRVQAHLPVARLQAVAQLAVVDAIRLPTYARRRAGNVTTEGDRILYTDAVRQQFGLDGTGVRVGVVSDGLKGVFATGCTLVRRRRRRADRHRGSAGRDRRAKRERRPDRFDRRHHRPVVSGQQRSRRAAATAPACSFAGAGAEGTALLEIVHDLAPGAKLSFANGDTDLAFNQAVNFLAASNDVVLDDIGFFGEPYDGTSGVSGNTAAALNNPSFPIRAYFTAVGNDADEHYFGTYADSRVDGTTIGGITTTGHLHLFQRTDDTTDVLGLGSQPYNVISLPQNGEVAIFLTWDDAFGASGNNYDLYLVQQSTGRVVASSTDLQSGRQDPVEAIDYVNRGAQDLFRIVVQNVRDAAQPQASQPLFVRAGVRRGWTADARAAPARAPQLQHRHAEHLGAGRRRRLAGRASSRSAPSVRRRRRPRHVSPRVPDESCLDTSNSTAEFFSSRGPTLDGRVKPDIAAIDGVSITGAGSFSAPFFGTSAAAPHMGGIAALLLQARPAC